MVDHTVAVTQTAQLHRACTTIIKLQSAFAMSPDYSYRTSRITQPLEMTNTLWLPSVRAACMLVL